ncbi:MAG: RagB/SusD family nutrient uptake outer membrane protein [Tannerella sp.]|jgi:hypothetical protein|nr:RagB/SusD family nutrient uptake outer membrane protein [Tannerella sp.]
MKNIEKISTIMIVAFVCLLALPACSDQFLEEKTDYTKTPPAEVFESPDLANAAYAYIYYRMFRNYVDPMFAGNLVLRQNNTGDLWQATEEQPWRAGSQYRANNDKNTKAGNFFPNPPYWNNNAADNTDAGTLFPNIYYVNEFIRMIDLEGRTRYDDKAFWDGLKGQTLFIRAWLYYDAVRFFGGVPYYSTDTDMPDESDRSPRLSAQECFDRVCEDFAEAATLLPARWEGADDGRFTSVAALAMISRVRLAAASPVFNASWETGTKRWQQALDASLAAEEAARAAGFGAISSIDAWDMAFYVPGAANSEAIIKMNQSDNINTTASDRFNRWEDQIRPGIARNTVGAQTGGGKIATEQIMAAFPMANGKPAVTQTLNTTTNMMEYTPANGYDDVKFYRNRDPRFYRTFAISGSEWPGTGTQIWMYAYRFDDTPAGNYRVANIGPRNDMGTRGRAIVWKMSNPSVPQLQESRGGTDILDYRFGELLLNVAECYAALGNTGQATNYLNQVRSRVGAGNVDLADFPAQSPKFSAIKAVLNERLIELAYEGKRPWDLRRWLLYEGGSGFDPVINGNLTDQFFRPEDIKDKGWKLYNGKPDFNGIARPEYTWDNNVLTRLEMNRISGTVWLTNKVWLLDAAAPYNIEPFDTDGNQTHPLVTNPDYIAMAATPIKREMNDAERNAAFDKLEAFYASSGLKTVWAHDLPPQLLKYGVNIGSSNTDRNYLFCWRGWYGVFPVHYDVYIRNQNDWLKQTEGWMTENANPVVANSDQQNGEYIYISVEE